MALCCAEWSQRSNKVSNPFVGCDDGTGGFRGAHREFTFSFEFGKASERPHAGANANGLLVRGRSGLGPNAGSAQGFFGPHDNSIPTWPQSNHVDFAPFYGPGREFGPFGTGDYNEAGPSILWRTKPRARVYTAFDPCIGLPRIPDIHASDVSNTSGSNMNVTQSGSNFAGSDSYVLLLVGTASWYLDSKATHHICRDASALNGSTPYSGNPDSGNITERQHS